MRFKRSTRQFIIASLYGTSATLAVVNLALTAGTLSTLEIILSLCGIVPWGIASMQSVYRKYRALQSDANEEINPTILSQHDEPAIRNSTHSIINALLNVVSASSFLISDLCYISAVTPAMQARLIGSSLWLTSSGLYCWLARQERRLENIPDLALQPKKINTSTYYFMGEIGFLAAGSLYYAAWWLDTARAPLKLVGCTCWLTAGTHDTLQAALTAKSEKQKTKSHAESLSQVQSVLFTAVPVKLPAPTITIDVIDDKKRTLSRVS